MTIVVDASVAIKWFVEENLVAEADEALHGSGSLFAPDLIVTEVTNIAWKKVIRGELEAEQARLIAASIHQGQLDLVPSTMIHQRALGIGLEIEHSIYDCLYLALAERLESPLVTADQRLIGKTKSTAYADLVYHLIDYLAAKPTNGGAA